MEDVAGVVGPVHIFACKTCCRILQRNPKIGGSSGLATGLGDTFEMDVQVQHKGGPALNICAVHGENGWSFFLSILALPHYQNDLLSISKIVTAKHVSSWQTLMKRL